MAREVARYELVSPPAHSFLGHLTGAGCPGEERRRWGPKDETEALRREPGGRPAKRTGAPGGERFHRGGRWRPRSPHSANAQKHSWLVEKNGFKPPAGRQGAPDNLPRKGSLNIINHLSKEPAAVHVGAEVCTR